MLHKFNTIVRLCIVAFLIIPFPVLADHVPTQPPYNQSIAIDTTTGDITIGIYTSDGWEDSPPEKYTIFFNINNDVSTDSFCVSTSFGHTGNLQWNYHTFSLSDLQTYFANPYGNFRTKIRSDNDTDNSFSTLTAQMAIDIPNQEPFVGVENWSEPTTTCNDTSTTTTTSSTLPPTTEAAGQEEVVKEETTTTSSTTTTTEPPPPPPPPPTTTTTLYVVVNEDGSTSEYTETEVEDGTVDRDNQRKANQDKYGCYMTDAQIDRGDCDIPKEEVVEEKEEVIIKEDEKEQPDTEEQLPNDDVVVPEVVVEDKDEDSFDGPKEEVKIDVEKLEEEFKFEEEEIIFEDIPEDIIIVIEEEVLEDELDQEIPGDDIIREETVQEEDVKDQVLQEVEVPVEFIVVEEITEEELEQVQAVVNNAIKNVEELTEEQVEVVAEVFQVKKEDIEIIAEAVKTDEVIAEAVEVYVERAVKNKDVENYTLADVVTEIQTEQFLADPIGAFIDINIQEIDLGAIGNDMTNDQKEKAQEVVVPVIIASQIVASVQVAPVRMRRKI